MMSSSRPRARVWDQVRTCFDKWEIIRAARHSAASVGDLVGVHVGLKSLLNRDRSVSRRDICNCVGAIDVPIVVVSCYPYCFSQAFSYTITRNAHISTRPALNTKVNNKIINVAPVKGHSVIVTPEKCPLGTTLERIRIRTTNPNQPTPQPTQRPIDFLLTVGRCP